MEEGKRITAIKIKRGASEATELPLESIPENAHHKHAARLFDDGDIDNLSLASARKETLIIHDNDDSDSMNGSNSDGSSNASAPNQNSDFSNAIKRSSSVRRLSGSLMTSSRK